MSENIPPSSVIARSKPRLSWAWLLPVLAAAATAWLFWSQWKSNGPEITILFEDAPGLQAGKSLLIYRGVQAGKVTGVKLDANLSKVVVTVRLTSSASELARQGTDFWIDQPEISLHRATGLDAIVQGNSIHARLGTGSRAVTFDGLAAEPLTPFDRPALFLKLRADSIPFLTRGAPVYFRGVAVGSVRDKQLDANGKPWLQVIIDEKHASNVLDNSRFWILPATSLHINGNGANIDFAGLSALVEGGIAFDQFTPGGVPAKTNAEFFLMPNEAAAHADGPLLDIAFDDGEGIVAGQTSIRCLGQTIGLVESASLDSVGSLVRAKVRLHSEHAHLANSSSIFTLVRPRISLEGVSGLETIITGPYIALEPGEKGESRTEFVGRTVSGEEWERQDSERGGVDIVLTADAIPNLDEGSPVLYRGIPVGLVTAKTFDEKERPILRAFVRREFRSLVRTNSRFWRLPATSVSAGPGVLKVDVQNFASLLHGAISFDDFGMPAVDIAPEHANFTLFNSESAARAISPPVQITFSSGRGILANRTELRYLGLPVGLVESVKAGRNKVEVIARFQPGYEFLCRKDSTFALVQPEITLQGVSSIETIISGVYIECVPSDAKETVEHFVGRVSIDPEILERTGFEIRIATASTGLLPGAQVLYRDMKVGEVTAKTLSGDGKLVVLTVLIDSQFRQLVCENSRFYDASGLEASLGFLKLKIKAPAILAAEGRLAFTNPKDPGATVSEGHLFHLQTKAGK